MRLSILSLLIIAAGVMTNSGKHTISVICTIHSFISCDWKNAEITAIFNEGIKSNSAYNRPISITSAVRKIIEYIIMDITVAYMND